MSPLQLSVENGVVESAVEARAARGNACVRRVRHPSGHHCADLLRTENAERVHGVRALPFRTTSCWLTRSAIGCTARRIVTSGASCLDRSPGFAVHYPAEWQQIKAAHAGQFEIVQRSLDLQDRAALVRLDARAKSNSSLPGKQAEAWTAIARTFPRHLWGHSLELNSSGIRRLWRRCWGIYAFVVAQPGPHTVKQQDALSVCQQDGL